MEPRLPHLFHTHRGQLLACWPWVVIARKKSVSHRPLFSFTVPEKASAQTETTASLVKGASRDESVFKQDVE